MEKVEMELVRARRRNRLSLAVVLLAFVLLVIAMTAVIGRREDVVKAKKFVVIDKNGMKRVELDAEFTPDLCLYDENGSIRVCLGGSEDGGLLNLFDKNGRHSVQLFAGGPKGPALILLNENDKYFMPSVWLDGSKTGPVVQIFDKNGKGRAALGVSKTTTPDGKITIYPESSLLLFDPNGNVVWMAPR